MIGIPALIAALVQGLGFVANLIPGLQGSKTVTDIEAALGVLAQVVPGIQNIVAMLQNPSSITQAQVDQAVSNMDALVTGWDNRANP